MTIFTGEKRIVTAVHSINMPSIPHSILTPLLNHVKTDYSWQLSFKNERMKTSKLSRSRQYMCALSLF